MPRPDGSSARTKRVAFTKSSAERIARVVRKVEAGNRGAQPLRFEPRIGGGGGSTFRMAAFTGAWEIDTFKTVTVYDSTQTLNVNNILFPVPVLSDDTQTPTFCAIAKDRSTWHLVNIQFSDNTVLTNVTLQPDALEFACRGVLAPSREVATAGVTITECDAEAASAEQINFFLR